MQQIALRHRGDGAGDFRGRPEQVVDQRVDGAFHLAPGAAGQTKPHALARLAFPADDLPDALELLRHALIGGHDLVERIGDLADQADLVAGHPHGEIADPDGLESMNKKIQVRGGGGPGAVAIGLFDRRNGGRAVGFDLADRISIRLHFFAPDESAKKDSTRSATTSISGPAEFEPKRADPAACVHRTQKVRLRDTTYRR